MEHPTDSFVNSLVLITEHEVEQAISTGLFLEQEPAVPPPLPGKGGKPTPPPQAFGLTTTEGPVNSAIAKALLKMNKEKLAKKGINVDSLRELGAGTMGVAFDMGGDKVLKVTGDAREAMSSAMVAGKNLPNVVQVYDVWQFPKTKFYGLVIEKLQPLSDAEANKLTTSIQELGVKSKEEAASIGVEDWTVARGFPALLRAGNDSFRTAQQLLAKLLTKRYYDKPNKQQLVAAAIADFGRLMSEYKMQALFNSLKQLGIQYFDFHGGNYGRRADGTIVLFDLGRSKVSGGTNPPELQERRRAVVKARS